jgi:parvulin-like peptidyl-prolyl isomerase
MKTFASWLVVTAIALASAPAVAQSGAVIQKIIVKVNGEPFTLTELEELQIEALQSQNQFVQDPEDLQNDASLQAALAEMTPVILVEAVDGLMMLQRAREIGVSFGDEEFDGAIDQIKSQNGLTDEGLQQAMAEQGLTMEALRQQLERQYMVGGVQQIDILPLMNLTDEEMRQYYEANPDEFMQEESVMLREIFIEVPTEVRDGQPVVNVAIDEAALEKMQAVRERALAGEDFAALVAEVSESASKDSGGVIGPINVAELAPTMRAVIDPLQEGGVSEPIRTSRGYQMLELTSRSAAAPQPFAEVQEEIRQRILDVRMEDETIKYLDGLREETVIEWKDDAYRAMHDAYLRARGTGSGSSHATPAVGHGS